MGEREALVKDLSGEYENLYGILMTLSDADKVRPMLDQWSVKDILAHTAAWLHEGAKILEGLAAGVNLTPEDGDSAGIDARNARFVEEWRDASGVEVETELHRAMEAFVRAMRALPEESFAEGEPARHVVFEEGIDHLGEHAAQIFEWKERDRVGQPVPPGMPRGAIG